MTVKSKERFERLEGILSLKRPAGGCTEREAINKFIKPTGAVADTFGNWHLKIGDTPIVWSCHTDTVHRKSGTQSIVYGTKDGCIYLDETIKRAECLGADDGAGIWLMLEMIDNRVPGHYVFHREEEIGGMGSAFLNLDATWTEYFKDYKAIIALDRRGYNDIITHQSGRCCSDKFANELADQLNILMYQNAFDDCDAETIKYYQWRPARGVWTDSANYTDTIGECTNLSVGYFSQHSYLECLDPEFLEELLSALCRLDMDALLNACERKPGEVEYVAPKFSKYTGYGKSKSAKCPTTGGIVIDDYDYDEDNDSLYRDMADVVETHPDEVAEILKAYGYGLYDLLDEIATISGTIYP